MMFAEKLEKKLGYLNRREIYQFINLPINLRAHGVLVSGFGFCLHVDFRYELVGVAWCNQVVAVCGFYEDAVAEVGDGDEGSAYAWDVVVSAVEAGSEEPEPERDQRSLNGLDCVG